jgi:hypothetical protein
MKYLKRFNENIDNKSLKERLKEYYLEISHDYDEEEIQNVLEILDECSEDLSDIKNLEKTLLLRMIDDENLYDEVSSISTPGTSNRNPFDDF